MVRMPPVELLTPAIDRLRERDGVERLRHGLPVSLASDHLSCDPDECLSNDIFHALENSPTDFVCQIVMTVLFLMLLKRPIVRPLQDSSGIACVLDLAAIPLLRETIAVRGGDSTY